MQVDTADIKSVVVPKDLNTDSLSEFEQYLSDLLKSSPKVLALDSSPWEHITSSHIHVLWHAYKACSEHGIRMQLTAPSAGLLNVLKVLDLYDIIAGGQKQPISNLKDAVQYEACKGTHKYADEFHADPKSVDIALEDFLVFLKELHIQKAVEFELRTLFYEVATNIRTHGQLEVGASIVFASLTNESGMVMTFVDSGIPFDPTTSTADFDVIAAGKNRQTRGFGIMMIRKLADKISYVRKADDINILTLEKRWGK